MLRGPARNVVSNRSGFRRSCRTTSNRWPNGSDIAKRIGWHTFRRTYTTLLHANGEDVKVVQELLRHGSSRITMDVYAQAVTPAKRKAQGKVVVMLRDTEKKTS